MNRKKKILLFLTLVFALGGVIAYFFCTQSKLATQIYETQWHDPNAFAQAMLTALQKGDTTGLARMFPTSHEFIALEKYLGEKNENPDGGRFIAMLMISENHKALLRWMECRGEYGKLRDAHFSAPVKIEDHNGVELWKKVRLLARNPKGEEVAVPVIRTLMRTRDGFKAYTLLDPEDD
ncbi:MAG TPA: hypothetical protein VLM37_10925 [Fibrobacteraceae bacterium]|nr:hypothetical protein [Fibrobacteraceae bacterium]